jgi:signal transduction histidine kinase
VALAAFTVGERAADRVTSAVSVLAVATVVALVLLAQDRDALPDVTLPYLILVPSWVVGDLLRTRRLDSLRRADDEARAAREREAHLEAALAEQRRQVARELHDVVAHGVGVMLIQAGAARQVVRTEPDRAEEALLAVEATGREAMAELRRLLGVLGDESDQGGIAPQPGVGQLDELVERVRQAGLPAQLQVDGEPRVLPSGIDVTIYRIAQEALTNALRYAQHARTLVHLAYDGSEVRLEVLDDGPDESPTVAGRAATDSTGKGIAGMRERASLVGGRLEAGPRLGGGYAVRAWLPTPTESA